MQSDDKPINGQHTNSPNFFDLLDQTPPPPVIDLEDDPGPKRFARLRTAWDASWKQGGFLYRRWEELSQARYAGFHGMANFLQTSTCLMRHVEV
jgi:hypothetical protein